MNHFKSFGFLELLLNSLSCSRDVHTPESSLLSPHVQAIINCTVTPSMTFTKTSQKFGQWADSRANTVYGLGFATEQQLHQVNQAKISGG